MISLLAQDNQPGQAQQVKQLESYQYSIRHNGINHFLEILNYQEKIYREYITDYPWFLASEFELPLSLERREEQFWHLIFINACTKYSNSLGISSEILLNKLYRLREWPMTAPSQLEKMIEKVKYNDKSYCERFSDYVTNIFSLNMFSFQNRLAATGQTQLMNPNSNAQGENLQMG